MIATHVTLIATLAWRLRNVDPFSHGLYVTIVFR